MIWFKKQHEINELKAIVKSLERSLDYHTDCISNLHVEMVMLKEVGNLKDHKKVFTRYRFPGDGNDPAALREKEYYLHSVYKEGELELWIKEEGKCACKEST